MVNIHTERKFEVNNWLIKARWLYGLGVLVIGLISKMLSDSNVNFSVLNMLLLFVIFTSLNGVFYFVFKKIKRQNSLKGLKILSLFQIGVEVVLLTIIMHFAGSIESIAIAFFFLPIVSASFLYGTKGSISVAVICSIVLNLLVIFEYYGIVPHVSRYDQPSLEFQSLPISLTKTITISIFYLIIGLYNGFGAKLLFKREGLLEDQRNKLDQKNKLITKREGALSTINAQLIEEKNKIGAIISNFTGPIIFINSKNEITLLNPIAKEVLGLSDNDLGKTISSENNYSLKNFHKLMKNEIQVDGIEDFDEHDNPMEGVEIKHNGQKRFYKVATTQVCEEDGDLCYGTLKIFYDLTREKAIDRMKSEFISIAAHQLRTPLSAIKWIIKMVLDEDTGKLNKEQKELLSKGYNSNERIIELVNDLLNVSRIEEGRFGYNFDFCDLQEIVNIVTENAQQMIAKNHIKFKVEKPEEMEKVYVDKEKILLVLQNLVDNAIKYTPEYGTVEISVKNYHREGFVQVSVEDNGVGIPEEDKEKLFTKFFRATNVMRMQTEGSGLGLFIAKNIVEKHGGEISAESEEGKGTKIIFTVPLKEEKVNKKSKE